MSRCRAGLVIDVLISIFSLSMISCGGRSALTSGDDPSINDKGHGSGTDGGLIKKDVRPVFDGNFVKKDRGIGPASDKGLYPDKGSIRKDRGGPPPPDKGVFPDACVRPPGYCTSSWDCPTGTTCEGCYPDPCCPMCDMCIGICSASLSCMSNNDCGPNQFCHIDGGCFSTSGMMGTCEERPYACPDNYALVCGCDGKDYTNECFAHAAGVNVQYPGSCFEETDYLCQNVTCGVLDDCCSCMAYKVDPNSPPPPSCPYTCFQPSCQAENILSPEAYCVKGTCLITDSHPVHQCTSDADCYLVNDCCSCLALPYGAWGPDCTGIFCDTTACSILDKWGWGIDVQARCIQGTCRVYVWDYDK